MASVEKRGPGSWRVGIRSSVADGRKWIRRSLTFPDTMPEKEQLARAELAAAQLELQYRQGLPLDLSPVTAGSDTAQPDPEPPMTVRAFADLWMTQHVTPNCKPTTAKTYRSFLDTRVLPALGDIPLANLDPLTITRFLNGLRGEYVRTTAIAPEKRKRPSDRERQPAPPRKLSDRTVRHHYDMIRDMLNMAAAWKLIPSNPIDGVAPPKYRKKRVKFLDDRQAVQLLRCLAKEESLSFRCAVLLALLCGLRLSEVGALSLDDVNWDQCTIDIHQGLNYTPELGNYLDTPKTDAGVRTIDLPAAMMTLLDENRKYQQEGARLLGDRWRGIGRIVCNWDGTPVHHDTPSKWFRKFADANGFTGVRFHDLRHTHATLLFADNIDAVAVASRLGHDDASTTLRIYAHAIRTRDLESAAAMQRLYDAAMTPPDSPDAPASPTGPASPDSPD